MKDCPGVDGLSCINGWLYSSIGGMIFSSNRKCSACNADPEIKERALGPPPVEGCECVGCVATRELEVVRLDLVRMTARNIELGVKVQDQTTEVDELESTLRQWRSSSLKWETERDQAIERANKVSGRLKLERVLSNDILYENKILHEQIAALESKEVCNLPHDDGIIEGCVYCKLEAAREQLAHARDLIRELEPKSKYEGPEG